MCAMPAPAATDGCLLRPVTYPRQTLVGCMKPRRRMAAILDDAPLLDRTRQQRLPRSGGHGGCRVHRGSARPVACGRTEAVPGSSGVRRRSGRRHALRRGRRSGDGIATALVAVGRDFGPRHFTARNGTRLRARQLRGVRVRGKQWRVRAIIDRRGRQRHAADQQHCQPQRRASHAAPGISAC